MPNLKAAQRPPPRVRPDPDQLPPHSPEDEAAIIACMLMDAKRCVPEVEATLTCPDDFYDLRHQVIVTSALKAAHNGGLDTVSLCRYLKEAGRLADVGGEAALMLLENAAPSATNLASYLQSVRDKASLRRMLSACADITLRIQLDPGDAETLLDQAEREVLAVRPERLGALRDTRTLVSEANQRIENQAQHAIVGLSTHISALDAHTRGVKAGQLIVIGAFSSQGKTTLAMQIARNVALKSGVAVGVFSFEMDAEELMEKMIYAEARVDPYWAEGGRFNEEQMARLGAASTALARAPLFIDDQCPAQVDKILARSRRLNQEHGIGLWVWDYLQLIDGPKAGKDVSREQEVSGVAKAAKLAARELKAPILLLSQLNDEGKLRESRAIGHHPDGVWKLRKSKGAAPHGAPEDADEEERRSLEAHTVPMDLQVLKHRGGRTGVVKLVFIKGIGTFELAAKIERDEES